MRDIIADLLGLLGAYAAAGLVFCVAFQAAGLTRVDPAARGAGVGFRLLVSPGIVALWPWLLARWRRVARGSRAFEPDAPAGAPARLRRVHALAWKGLAIAVPLLLAVALGSRPADRPGDAAPWPARGASPTLR